MSSLKAGVARADITPPVGFTEMWGYASRRPENAYARGVLDPLYAKALVLENGGQAAALITVDLGAIDPQFTAEVRREVTRLTSIPGSAVMLVATHSHAAPTLGENSTSLGAIDPVYREDTKRKIAGAVYIAWQQREPARLGSGRGAVSTYIAPETIAKRESNPFRWGYEARKDDAILANKVFRGEPFFPITDLNKDTEYAQTPVDPEVGVIRIDRERGGPLAVVFNFGCHPDVLGPNNVWLSADFPGRAARIIEQNVGGSALALYCQGAGGDIRMVLTFTREVWTQTVDDLNSPMYADLERIGGVIAHEALKTWHLIETRANVPVRALAESVTLPLWNPPTASDLERYIAQQEVELAEAKAGRGKTGYGYSPVYDIKTAETRLNWGKRMHEGLSKSFIDPQTLTVEVQAINLGNEASCLGIPGEVFAVTSLKLKKALADRLVVLCSQANGLYGYLLPAGVHEEGGYWLERSPQFYTALSATAAEGEVAVRQTLIRLARSG
jgi:neutral ceramidase